MSLSIGIVGLPNAGKSTLFNALIKNHQAKVENYPFTTIEPNVGIVEVPDEHLFCLGRLLGQGVSLIPAGVKFIDIAGLVKNAHQGEGLGNQFLAHIREVDAIIHIFRAFSNPDVVGELSPKDDIETINIELELADIKKPTIYVANISEGDIGKKIDYGIKETIIPVCAKMEMELAELSGEEQKEYLKSSGLTEPALNRVIVASYKLLGLITMYTLKPNQIQAWPVKNGATALVAAGQIHTDFAENFITAEVIEWQKLIEAGGWTEAKEKGLIRHEGRDYLIRDGDVVYVRTGKT
ncbi:MAG: obg-like ATPase 1-like [Candidatus Berkelbacteria bacterium Licking1014_2]|uniref:Obg-like ATPase 1-like n=1 Tax=Candidatus Berkelbacteria bacterium Licking1014_2 TaxID=2017146 RepID=A0A554LX89_9BACT|nr:MAG: obg-like ATPase 1-like [Candidatus Berkelbacteria bacterium Licking1014_2]